MFLQAEIKCNKDSTPYRIYINDELITERFYTVPHGALAPIEGKPSGINFEDISNILHLEIVDADNYDVRVENIPGGPQEKVWIEEVKWQPVTYNPSLWDQIDDPVAAGLKGEALRSFREKYGTK